MQSFTFPKLSKPNHSVILYGNLTVENCSFANEIFSTVGAATVIAQNWKRPKAEKVIIHNKTKNNKNN
jgi:hypothetical protein